MPEQRFTFDAVAEQYARARPGYPAALYDDLIALSGLPEGGRILEIGAGGGNATAPLTARGYDITCLEPGPNLAAVARRLGVRVEVTSFEDWPPEPEPFDLVFAAQSFHWVDPAVRCKKAAAVLRPGGALAVIANRPEIRDHPVDQAIQRVYETLTPEMVPSGDTTNKLTRFSGELQECGLFAHVVGREYPWTQRYTAAQYLELQNTHSDHLLMDAGRRERLLAAVAAAIEAHGGAFEMHRTAILVVASRWPG